MNDVDLVHVVAHQLIERVEVVGVLIVCVVVTRDDIHGDAILTQLIQEVFTIRTQGLEVDEPPVLVVIAEMKDMFDIVLKEIWEEDIRIEVLLVVDKNITGVSYPSVCVI